MLSDLSGAFSLFTSFRRRLLGETDRNRMDNLEKGKKMQCPDPLYVFFMYSLCILYVFFMYSLCILYVFFMYSLCIS